MQTITNINNPLDKQTSSNNIQNNKKLDNKLNWEKSKEAKKKKTSFVLCIS